MKIREYIGKAIVNLGLKITDFGFYVAGYVNTSSNNGALVHAILGGPFTKEDLGLEWEGPQGANTYLTVKMEAKGSVKDVDWYFGSLDDAYVWVKHFKSSIEPLVLRSNN